VNGVREMLERERLAATLDRNDCALRLGRHSNVLTELATTAAEHPLDERVAGQLMLALYRSGRSAEALDQYRRIRDRLAEQLGTDPTPALAELHRRILNADPSLGHGPGISVPDRPEPAAAPVPRQLPAPPPVFVGRVAELATISAAILGRTARGALPVVLIGGPGGVGKTWLAVHWAHQNIDQFPDGQLYLNLRGFDPSGSPVPREIALHGLLRALGLPPAAVPMHLDTQVGLYRSLTAGKRILVVLDNARDTTQIEPLLPGSPTCAVLVTSRHRLAGLLTTHGAVPLALDVLNRGDAHHLMSACLGSDRVDAESQAVQALLDQCAGLPLALSIVIARAARHRALPLADLAEELLDADTRLDALSTGDGNANLRAVFSCSHQALDEDLAEVLELVALAPGPDIGVPAAAALIDRPRGQTRMLLGKLEDAHLVQPGAQGRHRMHDLIRLYATEVAGHRSAETRTGALRRLVEFYVHTAYAADRLLRPHSPPIRLHRPTGPGPAAGFDTADAGLSWLHNEHACLLAVHRFAAEQGWHTAVWQLADALDTFHHQRGLRTANLAMWRAAAAAAEALSDPAVQLLAQRDLGRACSAAGRHDEALAHLGRALAIAEQTGDTGGQAYTYLAVAWAWELIGDDHLAAEYSERARRLFQQARTAAWEAVALNEVGWYAARMGSFDRARRHCEQSLRMFRRLGNPVGEAATLDGLGYVAYRTGRYPEAVEYYQATLTLYRRLGNSHAEADTLDRLAETYAAAGLPERARRVWRSALGLYLSQHRPADVQRLRGQLAADEQEPGTVAVGHGAYRRQRLDASESWSINS